jgi:hypothetical protein
VAESRSGAAPEGGERVASPAASVPLNFRQVPSSHPARISRSTEARLHPRPQPSRNKPSPRFEFCLGALAPHEAPQSTPARIGARRTSSPSRSPNLGVRRHLVARALAILVQEPRSARI